MIAKIVIVRITRMIKIARIINIFFPVSAHIFVT